MSTSLVGVSEQIADKSVTADYSRFVVIGGALAVVGIALFAMALLGDGSHRAWQSFHVNWIFFMGLTCGSVVITAVHKIANAKWSGVILRLSQAPSAFMPFLFLGFLLIMTVGYQDIYGQMNTALAGLSHSKALWLSHTWMTARMGLGILLLFALSRRLIRRDMLPDLVLVKDKVTGGRQTRYESMLRGYNEAENHTKIYRLAGLYAPVYALVMTIVAFDGIMALQPHWFSNLLGGWYFMGSFLAGNMLLALNLLYARKAVGLGDLISSKQQHDLGKLCFGFTVFWMYLLWAQFLVIWYGNLPEETGFIFTRLWGAWRPLGATVFLGAFVVPFGGLLSVGAKKTGFTLALFACISLSALWLERYLLVMPSISAENGPLIGIPEVGSTLMFIGLFTLSYGWFAKTYPMVSPRLAMITLEKEAAQH